MARKPTDKRRSTNDAAEDVDGNVDKIRDILFGGQMRDYDQRFATLEKRLTDIIERSTRDIERRIDKLDGYSRREIEKLGEQLKAERKDRQSDSKQGATEVQELTDQVEIWFAEVDEQHSADTKELRNALLEQTSELTTHIKEAREQMMDALQQETQSLSDDKVAREDLATLLTEVATRLTKNNKRS